MQVRVDPERTALPMVAYDQKQENTKSRSIGSTRDSQNSQGAARRFRSIFFQNIESKGKGSERGSFSKKSEGSDPHVNRELNDITKRVLKAGVQIVKNIISPVITSNSSYKNGGGPLEQTSHQSSALKNKGSSSRPVIGTTSFSVGQQQQRSQSSNLDIQPKYPAQPVNQPQKMQAGQVQPPGIIMQQKKKTSPSVTSNNQMPTKIKNTVPQKQMARNISQGSGYSKIGSFQVSGAMQTKIDGIIANQENIVPGAMSSTNQSRTNFDNFRFKNQTQVLSTQQPNKGLVSQAAFSRTTNDGGDPTISGEYSKSSISIHNKNAARQLSPIEHHSSAGHASGSKSARNRPKTLFESRCQSKVFGRIERTLDRKTMGNVYEVSEYCGSIHNSMLTTEKKWQADPTYMLRQERIDETCRSTLIDWLVQIHYNFNLLPETLYLTVNMFDRFCSIHQIARREVQLVGIAALLTIAKYEEIYPPTLKDFVKISGDAYTPEQVLNMERKMLFSLDFDVSQGSAYRFLERFSKLAKLDNVQFFLAQYMLELGLLDSKMSQFSQSLQAVAAIYTAKKYLTQADDAPGAEDSTDQDEPNERDRRKGIQAALLSRQGTINLMGTQGYHSADQMKSCSDCFQQLAHLIQRSKLQNVVRKFKTGKFFEVARIVTRQESNSGKQRKQESSEMQKANSESSLQKSGTKANGRGNSQPATSSFLPLPKNDHFGNHV